VKVCSKCGAEGPFPRDDTNLCRPCLSAYNKAYRRRTRSSKTPKEWEAFDLRRQKRQSPQESEEVQRKIRGNQRHECTPEVWHQWQNKKHRVYEKRKRGKIICFWCEQPIPPLAIAKAGKKHPPQFCSKTCVTEKRKILGTFRVMGQKGNNTQKTYKEKYGVIPQYEKRRDAVTYSNTINPRRKRKEQG
jgi:hypothetical protein